MKPTILLGLVISGLLAAAPLADSTGGAGQGSDTRYREGDVCRRLFLVHGTTVR